MMSVVILMTQYSGLLAQRKMGRSGRVMVRFKNRVRARVGARDKVRVWVGGKGYG